MFRDKSFIVFFAVLLSAAFTYGVLVGKYQFFPYSILKDAHTGFRWFLQKADPSYEWFYAKESDRKNVTLSASADTSGSLNLISRVGKDNTLAIEVRDMRGEIVHEWPIDWFENWPDPQHLTEMQRPKSAPGGHIHGAIITGDGDLVFNFEYLGLMKMDRAGNVLWRLPVRTHHSVFQADNGNYWVCAAMDRALSNSFPAIKPDAYDDHILEVSPNGKIIQQISMIELLEKNDLRGLLFMNGDVAPQVTPAIGGDFLHLNDVEVYPAHLAEGFFRHGDIMVSMRDISTVLVFDPDTWKIKFRATGFFNNQHDPDFVDSETITLFDNNPHGYADRAPYSRILSIHAPSGEYRVVYEGNEEHPFYTDIMGKHQWLPDGNLLITESRKGRAFEVTPEGKTVWEYVNRLDDGLIGLVDEVQRLSPAQAAVFTTR